MASSGSLYYANSRGERRACKMPSVEGPTYQQMESHITRKTVNGKANKLQKIKKIIPSVSKACNNMSPKGKGEAGSNHNRGWLQGM